MTKILEYVASILTVLGIYCISDGLLMIGFSVNILSLLLWVVFSYRVKFFGLLLLDLTLLLINVKGLIQL